MTWCIYKHTSPSNKSYIGMTYQDPNVRWKNGAGYSAETKFGKAIQKYGWDNFTHEIIEENIQTLCEAKEREIYWIDYFDSYKNGYNSTIGGDNVSIDRETNLPVYQLDYNLKIVNEFPTLADAGRALGISPSGIMESVRPDGNQISAGGFYWCLKENYTPEWKPRIDLQKKPVICVETGQIFDSEVEAADFSGLTQAAISACCYEKTITCMGKHWVFLSNYNENWKPREPIEKRRPTSKQIVCIETGEIYKSVSEAARLNFTCRSSITRACLEANRTANNKHFAYLKEET